MYYPQILGATHKVTPMCCIFFSGERKTNLLLEMEFMAQFCINTFTIIYLWIPYDVADVLKLVGSEFESKRIPQIIRPHLFACQAQWPFSFFPPETVVL